MGHARHRRIDDRCRTHVCRRAIPNHSQTQAHESRRVAMTDAPAPPAPSPEPRGGIARASAILASGTFVSRILGLVSFFVIARTLGLGGAGADAFTLGNQLPNNI